MLKSLSLAVSMVWLFCTSPAVYSTELACKNRFEDQDVTIIVPHNAGGGYDTISRVFAPHYATATGANVRVENVPGSKGLKGVSRILQAEPDGLTLGIVNGPKRILAYLMGDKAEDSPHLLENFTILARAASSGHVWVTNKDSPYPNIATLLQSGTKPVFGTTDLASGSLISTILVADILGFDFDIVTGLKGTSNIALAAMRGDIDFFSRTYHSVYSNLQSGELLPILQVADHAIAQDDVLKNVPLLGGSEGIASTSLNQSAYSQAEITQKLLAVASLTRTGRLIVSRSGLDKQLESCLRDTVMDVLNDEHFLQDVKKANQKIDAMNGYEIQTLLEESIPVLEQSLDILQSRLNTTL